MVYSARPTPPLAGRNFCNDDEGFDYSFRGLEMVKTIWQNHVRNHSPRFKSWAMINKFNDSLTILMVSLPPLGTSAKKTNFV